MTTCPKCQHVRNSNDDPNVPEYQCPNCSVIYAKVIKKLEQEKKNKELALEQEKSKEAPEESTSTTPEPYRRLKIIIIVSILMVLLVTNSNKKPVDNISVSLNKPSPFSGLSDEQYSRCINLGSQVMNNRKKYGSDSSQHTSSYTRWNSQCSLIALWEVAKNQNASFPNAPLDWANRK